LTTSHDRADAQARAPESFAALRNRGFRAYFVTYALAMTADNIEHVISYWMMFQKFQSALGMRAFSGVTVGLLGALIGIHWSLALSAMTLLTAVVALLALTSRAAPSRTAKGPPAADASETKW